MLRRSLFIERIKDPGFGSILNWVAEIESRIKLNSNGLFILNCFELYSTSFNSKPIQNHGLNLNTFKKSKLTPTLLGTLKPNQIVGGWQVLVLWKTKTCFVSVRVSLWYCICESETDLLNRLCIALGLNSKMSLSTWPPNVWSCTCFLCGDRKPNLKIIPV